MSSHAGQEVATIRFAANPNDKENNDNAAGANPSSLDRKFQLLEARFTTPTPGGSSPSQAALPPSSSSSSPSASHHSFAFDPPSRSNSTAADSNMSTPSNLPSSSVRPKRRSPAASSSLRAVTLAAERQMRKIQSTGAGSSPLPGMTSSSNLPFMEHDHEKSRSMSNLPSHSESSSMASNQTLLTSHRAKTSSHPPSEPRQPQVVAESPPTLASPALGAPMVPEETKENNKPSAARSVLGTKQDKRKSVPVKRPLPSVTEKQPTAHSNAITPGQGKTSTTPLKTEHARKRSRLQFAPVEGPTPIARSASPTPRNHSQHSQDASSRDRSNPSRSGKATKAPRNNTLIEDFFRSAIKNKGNEKKSAPAEANAVPITRPRILSVAESAPSKETSTEVVSSTSSSSSTRELDRLRQKLLQLEQSCNDKDEQLKAVANNQTIMHTALKAALGEREKELEDLKSASDKRYSTYTRVIESIVRSESAKEARELREKLASDGARLGRLVYTRAGLHSLESWEEGHASRQLRKRRAELKAKREALEQRQETARRAAERVRANKENVDTNGSSQPKEFLKAGGILVQDELAAMEAQESVRLHLDTIKQQEAALKEEEHALHHEKGTHIRNLKRVASEDASRFRSRQKLHGRYVPLSLLGKGGFSEVWRAYDLLELREVAVKIHQLDPRWSDAKKENYTKHVSREYEIHRDVRHPRIVSLYDVFEIDNNSFATVLELCKGTDLDTLLKEKKTLPERDARAILLQILSGMRYLSLPSSDGSRQGIIHYDLKPGNILFDGYGDAKITDFGLSKIVDAPDPADSMELTSQGAGTYWYLPPECFVTHQSIRISNKVDVWSIGVIYYQMLYGKRPFGDGLSQDKVLSNNTMLNAREVKFPDTRPVSKEGKLFLQQCLTYDQAFRPTIGQLCQNPYLTTKL